MLCECISTHAWEQGFEFFEGAEDASSLTGLSPTGIESHTSSFCYPITKLYEQVILRLFNLARRGFLGLSFHTIHNNSPDSVQAFALLHMCDSPWKTVESRELWW